MGIHFICFIQKCKVFQPWIETKYGSLEDIEICKAILQNYLAIVTLSLFLLNPLWLYWNIAESCVNYSN